MSRNEIGLMREVGRDADPEGRQNEIFLRAAKLGRRKREEGDTAVGQVAFAIGVRAIISMSQPIDLEPTEVERYRLDRRRLRNISRRR